MNCQTSATIPELSFFPTSLLFSRNLRPPPFSSLSLLPLSEIAGATVRKWPHQISSYNHAALLSLWPLPETMSLVEYVTDLAHKAQDIGAKRGKLSVEDFLYLIRNDLPQLNRCAELVSMQEELKQARKAFEVDQEKLATIE